MTIETSAFEGGLSKKQCKKAFQDGVNEQNHLMQNLQDADEILMYFFVMQGISR